MRRTKRDVCFERIVGQWWIRFCLARIPEEAEGSAGSFSLSICQRLTEVNLEHLNLKEETEPIRVQSAWKFIQKKFLHLCCVADVIPLVECHLCQWWMWHAEPRPLHGPYSAARGVQPSVSSSLKHSGESNTLGFISPQPTIHRSNCQPRGSDVTL